MNMNCRNCKWAGWSKTATGLRRFGNWAPCKYPVSVELPASRASAARALSEQVGVYQYDDVPIVCAKWEKVAK